jgi:putative MATE family efflux protein
MAFIGQYTIDGLSAVQTVRAPFFAVFSIFYAIGQGTTILVAQAIGAGKKLRARHYAETAFFFNSLISLAYFFFWLVAGKGVLILAGAKGEILDLAWQYLFHINFIFLFYGFPITAVAIFEGLGLTVPILVSAVIRSVLNIVLDWAMIFGHLGFPEMGIRGAAIATAISELIGAILVVAMVMRNRKLAPRFNGIVRPRFRHYASTIRVGLPAGIEYGLWAIGVAVLVGMLNRIGSLESGLFGVLDVILALSVYVYLGIGTASISLVGQATGARDDNEAVRTGTACVLLAFFVCAITGVVFLIVPERVVSIFSKDSGQAARLIPLLAVLVAISFPKAYNIVGANAIRGRGDTKFIMYNQAIGTVIIIGLAYLVLFVLGWGLAGLLAVILFDEVWRAFLNGWRFYSFYSKRKNRIERVAV